MYKLGKILGYVLVILGIVAVSVLTTLFFGAILAPILNVFYWTYVLCVLPTFLFIGACLITYVVVCDIRKRGKNDGGR